MSEQPKRIDHAAAEDEHTFTEQIEIAGSELVDRTKELIAEGNVRRLIVRNQDDEVLLEVPLTTGVAVGGVVTLIAPVLAALGAMAALLTHVKVEIVRAKPSEGDEGGSCVTGDAWSGRPLLQGYKNTRRRAASSGGEGRSQERTEASVQPVGQASHCAGSRPRNLPYG